MRRSCLLILCSTLMSMPALLAAARVWVSMTTIPSRIDFIEPAVRSILDSQTYAVEGLILNLPHEISDRSASLRERGNRQDMMRWYPARVPSFLNRSRLHLNRCKDIGALTKLVPTLRLPEVASGDMIITVDDDVEYGETTVQRLVTATEAYPNAAIGLEGYHIAELSGEEVVTLRYLQQNHNRLKEHKDEQVDVLQGVGAVLYHRRFFEDDFLETNDLPASVIGEDDVWISGYLQQQHIQRIHLSLDREGNGMAKPIKIGALGAGSGVDSLSWHAPNERRAEVLGLLRKSRKVFLPSQDEARNCFIKQCNWAFAKKLCYCHGHKIDL